MEKASSLTADKLIQVLKKRRVPLMQHNLSLGFWRKHLKGLVSSLMRFEQQ
jgi:hypothetical protein